MEGKIMDVTISASSNYEAAFAAERKRVTKCFHQYTADQCATLRASNRMGHRQRLREGEFFYVHPDIPNLMFKTRKAAAEAALTA